MKYGRISPLLIVIFGIIFGAVGIDSAFKNRAPQPVLNGRPLSQSEAKAFDEDIRQMVAGGSASYEPQTEGGRILKSIADDAAKAEAKFAKARGRVFTSSMLQKLGTKDGRTELRVGIALLAPEIEEYFDSNDAGIDRLETLLGRETMANRLALFRQQSSEIRFMHREVSSWLGKLIDYCDEQNAQPTKTGLDFKTNAQIEGFDAIAGMYDDAVKRMTDKVSLVAKQRSRAMQDALVDLQTSSL